MDDSISRQQAIKAIITSRFLVDAIEKITKLPSAQSYIRCKECIHWKHSKVRKSYCDVFDWSSKPNDFCSYAERQEE